MKRITIRDEAGYCVIANLIINDDWRIKVEHEDGRIEFATPERISDEISAQLKHLEALLNPEGGKKYG